MTDYLADSNIFLRSLQEDHPQYLTATRAIANLLARRDRIFLVPQVIYELWSVCTRPEGPQPAGENGLAMTPQVTALEIQRLKLICPVKTDNEYTLDQWFSLVTRYGVISQQAHDARLVAAMLVHGITHLLTFNSRHFERYTEITIVHPSEVTP